MRVFLRSVDMEAASRIALAATPAIQGNPDSRNTQGVTFAKVKLAGQRGEI